LERNARFHIQQRKKNLHRLHFEATSPLLLPIVSFAAVPPKVANELREQQVQLQALWLRIVKDHRAENSIGKINAELALAITRALLHWVSQWHREISDAEGEEVATETAYLWAVRILPLTPKRWSESASGGTS